MTYAKVDKNQTAIVKAFRDLGASVLILSTVGKGCPDTCIGYRGLSVLVEIKDGKGKLTPDQEKFHASWRGDVRIVRTVDEVAGLIAAMGG